MLPEPVLKAWELLPSSVRPLGAGLINRTFHATTRDGSARVIQEVNPVFAPEVTGDIDRVTRHLAQGGLATPRVVPAADGRLWLSGENGSWRALTYVPGRSLDALAGPGQARAAGALLGRFHRCLANYDPSFASRRPPIHDLARHLAALEAALGEHGGHRDFDRIAPLAEEILEAAGGLAPLPATPPRVVHGDPKANNILFHETRDEALCLVDLDTLGRMALPLELGDALRSWCNPSGEDEATGAFSAPLFQAAVEGYGSVSRGWILAEETGAIVAATANIQVELAARFCADALNERYFGWDAGRFGSRSEHNRVRAAGQLAVHRSLMVQRNILEKAVDAAFAHR
jgi:Ser/Thr protein kinase RdoA (MazF antagonist)